MGKDSESEAVWAVSEHGAATPSIIFAPLGFDSCSTSFKVTDRRGQEVVTGAAMEPCNG